MTDLRYLGAQNTRLKGTLPSQLGLLTQLTVLDLGYNYITGTVPSELQPLTLLASLRFVCTKLLEGDNYDLIPGGC